MSPPSAPEPSAQSITPARQRFLQRLAALPKSGCGVTPQAVTGASRAGNLSDTSPDADTQIARIVDALRRAIRLAGLACATENKFRQRRRLWIADSGLWMKSEIFPAPCELPRIKLPPSSAPESTSQLCSKSQTTSNTTASPPTIASAARSWRGFDFIASLQDPRALPLPGGSFHPHHPVLKPPDHKPECLHLVARKIA